ncbi:ANTAR domain-containing protein [Cryobacterium sp. MDB1-18-2]|uniref:GAF and ANTAR domain-containing protein n=1 Tax=unclassified Cryobacterium TaxID=2649013 RepID=UPI001069FA10|nr:MULTISPECIES: GAF and ANTAR domain-containing protein [unclassified Cryobacterium]TFC24386.1 ANTAR domain-containing protein [Cryobacterium sp. MDB1-18-2]TFC42054.1 ANTAR domain-containing protein [Cryobacterium sp. MDB1-18-1]
MPLSQTGQVICEGGRNDWVLETLDLAPRRADDVMHDSNSDFVIVEPTDLCSPFIDELDVTGVSIAVFGPRGGQSTLCSSDAVAARIDELQFDLGEGPQWATLRTGTPTLVPDVLTGTHDSWPIFAASIGSLDVGALFAFPLLMGAVTIGTVGLYRRTAGALSPRHMEIAVTLASALADVAVHHAIAGADAEGAGESMLTPAMRREVHQATGMILVQLDTTATIAYSRLQAYAFANGRSVQDVARDVVSRHVSFRSLPE